MKRITTAHGQAAMLRVKWVFSKTRSEEIRKVPICQRGNLDISSSLVVSLLPVLWDTPLFMSRTPENKLYTKGVISKIKWAV